MHPLKMVLLVDGSDSIDSRSFEDNESIFGKIAVVRLRRKREIERIVDELLARDMFNQGWELSNCPAELEGYRADVLLASPFSAVAKWKSAGLSRPERFECRIAAVNDCTTAEYFYRETQSFGNLRLALKGKLDRLRSRMIASIEARTLEVYDHILMQTSTDLALMRKLVAGKIADRVTLVPNGVRREFFDVHRVGRSPIVVFIAELSGEYAPIADWLIREVWPAVLDRAPMSRFMLVGKGGSPSLKTAIAQTRNIEHVEFVDDLRSVYSKAAVAICPVFKGYGLINKTLEAMASGVPVIGGAAAFNGIEGFQDGVHGLVCRPRHTEDFALTICDLLANHSHGMQIGAAGRHLIDNQFRWEVAVGNISDLIAKTCNSKKQHFHD